VNELRSTSRRDDSADSSPNPRSRICLFTIVVVLLIVATATVTLTLDRLSKPEDRSSSDNSIRQPSINSTPTSNEVSLDQEQRDTVLDSVTIPADEHGSSQLRYEVDIGAVPMAAYHAAFVSFEVECTDGSDSVAMKTTGKAGTNVLLSRGAKVSGQALTSSSDSDLRCELLARTPFVDSDKIGTDALPVRAGLRREPTDATNTPANHELRDATLLEAGSNTNVLSLKVDDPASLEEMSTTVRLTSCTVVGGSRDSGKNKCTKSMSGRESSTVRLRIIARWLDRSGRVMSTTTYWDEMVAIDYNTHHLPWNLRQADLADRVPPEAQAGVLVVQVSSVAGTPAVVHADGTDSVVTTSN